MNESSTISVILIFANVLNSMRGFKVLSFFERFKFETEKILVHKEYYRLVSSGFLHVDWPHLIFNMISLYAFSGLAESGLGPLNMLIVYFSSLIGGGLLSLFIHRNHSDYSAVGASGAVCGVIFASIAMYPGIEVGLIFLPLHVKGWVFGLAYIVWSIYGVRSRRDNIGHDAHLGGAMIGLLTVVMMHPSLLLINLPTILVISVPAIAFILFILYKPEFLLIDNLFYKRHAGNLNIDHRYNANKQERQKELDRLLDKISAKGIQSLSEKEKKRLDELSG